MRHQGGPKERALVAGELRWPRLPGASFVLTGARTPQSTSVPCLLPPSLPSCLALPACGSVFEYLSQAAAALADPFGLLCTCCVRGL